MRWLDGLFVLLFLMSVVVQYNDPDPLLWMTGYGVAMGLTIAAWYGHFPVVPNLLAGIAFMIWFSTLAGTLPGAPLAAFSSFEMAAPSYEEPREAMGLLIAATWTFSLAARGLYRRRRRSS